MHRAHISEGKEAPLIFSLRLPTAFLSIKDLQGNERVLTLKQTHSDAFHVVEDFVECLEGDALLTQRRGLPLGVRTADCVPLVLVGKRTLGVVHAGWRGLRANIIEKVFGAFVELEGDKPYFAFVGPSAKACCYKVGKEFKENFLALHIRNTELYMDTQEEATLRLRRLGIKRLFVYGVCTVCSYRLPSYRRDKTQRRLLTYAYLL